MASRIFFSSLRASGDNAAKYFLSRNWGCCLALTFEEDDDRISEKCF